MQNVLPALSCTIEKRSRFETCECWEMLLTSPINPVVFLPGNEENTISMEMETVRVHCPESRERPSHWLSHFTGRLWWTINLMKGLIPSINWPVLTLINHPWLAQQAQHQLQRGIYTQHGGVGKRKREGLSYFSPMDRWAEIIPWC